MNILVTGSNGQLGNEIKEIAKELNNANFFFYDLPELDITDKTLVTGFIEKHAINTIVNCAAYTAVDKAEDQADLAFKVNVTGPKILAEAAVEYSCKLIHTSTDFVFGGEKNLPYTENDACNPNSVYGKTKLEGEQQVMAICKNSITVRTSWLYSTYGNNFVKTMLRLAESRSELGIVYDQVGTPTYAADFAKAILKILVGNNNHQTESILYHFSNEGVASWYDFAQAIFEITGTNCKAKPILTHEYPLPAKRPCYSVMDKSKIKKDFDIDIAHWQTSLEKCLKKMNKS